METYATTTKEMNGSNAIPFQEPGIFLKTIHTVHNLGRRLKGFAGGAALATVMATTACSPTPIDATPTRPPMVDPTGEETPQPTATETQKPVPTILPEQTEATPEENWKQITAGETFVTPADGTPIVILNFTEMFQIDPNNIGPDDEFYFSMTSGAGPDLEVIKFETPLTRAQLKDGYTVEIGGRKFILQSEGDHLRIRPAE